MRTDSTEQDDEAPQTPMKRETPAVVLGLYLLVIVAATWPFAMTFGSKIPSTGDPLQHLWVMRWYKQCLVEGKSPLICPELQYPAGASLGNFSPLHLQSLVYLIVSPIVQHDAARYNLVWLTGLLLTGMGTFALARYVLRDDGAATLAGLLAMLSGPVMVHSHAHVELVYVGGFPIFLLTWMRFIDRPGLGRMIGAAAGFVFLGMCAAYFLVFALFPAGLYLVWKASRQPKAEVRPWLLTRIPWLVGFVVASLPVILCLFAGQFWNAISGQASLRPRAEFDRYGAPWWAYFVPVPGQVLQGFFPFDVYGVTQTPGEGVAYLGIVTIGLLARAWVGGVRFRDSGFWWLTTSILVVLSLGSSLNYGIHRIGLPAGWLRDWEWFVPFRLIRVPARFKLFVPVCTGIIAGAAWMRWRRRWSGPVSRRIAFGVVLLVAVADLAHIPYNAEPVPDLPKGYAWIRDKDPEAAWVDVPHMNSGNAHALNSVYTYWQALHGGRTTAGYSGHQNKSQDDLVSWNSPFADTRLIEANFPGPSGTEHFDLVRNADFRDYTWLYLMKHDLRFVILHRWANADGSAGYQLDRVAELLSESLCFDDGELAVFDRDRMSPPRAPVVLGSDNWGGYYLLPRDGFVRLASRSSAVELYNPQPIRPLVFAFEAKALGDPKKVTLTDGKSDLWTWDVAPGDYGLYVSPPFLVQEHRAQLRIESDDDVPASRVRKRFEGERLAASMVVRAICLRWEEPGDRLPTGVLATDPGAEPGRAR